MCVGFMSRGRTWRNRRKAAHTSHATSTSHESQYVQLLKWMTKNKFLGSHLQPAEFKATGRGLMAKKKLGCGDTLVAMPAKLLITTTTVLESEIGSYIKRCRPALSPLQVLCIYLIWERSKGTTSFWYPYINVLPKTYTTPGFFEEKDLESLPKTVRDEAGEHRDSIQNSFSGLVNFLDQISQDVAHCRDVFSYDAFRWAWSAVNTRCVYMKQPPNPHLAIDEDHYALAPFLDLLNHSPHVQTKAEFNKVTGCYEIVSLTSFAKYEQAFICYGPHDNTKLFIEYGFALPSNPHNTFQFTKEVVMALQDQDNEKIFRQKLNILEENQLTRELTCSMSGPSWKLMTALRVLGMTYLELRSWKQCLSGEPVSERNERQARCWARILLKRAMEKLPNKEGQKCPELNEHTSIAQQLWQDYSDVLRISLKKLKRVTFYPYDCHELL